MAHLGFYEKKPHTERRRDARRTEDLGLRDPGDTMLYAATLTL